MTKENAKDAAAGCTAIGGGIAGVGALSPVSPAAVGFGGGMAIGQGGFYLAAAIWDSFAKEEVDSNFDRLPIVAPVRFRPFEGEGEIFASLNSFASAVGEMLDSSRLLLQATKKLRGAIGRRSQDAAVLQWQATQTLLDRVQASIAYCSLTLRDLNRYAQEPPIADIKVSRDEVLQTRDRIFTSGNIPEFEQFVFEDTKATREEIRLVFEEMRSTSGRSLPPIISGKEICLLMSRSLNRVVIREYAIDLPDLWDLIGTGPFVPPRV